MADENTEVTLRDEIAKSFDAVEQQSTIAQTAAVKDAKPAIPAVEKPRDEHGKFVKDAPTNLVSPSATPAKTDTAQIEAKRPARPSSWKKEFDSHWETLDPKLAEYIHQREREYASGVSTYKSEAEQAKQLNDAIAPFLPNLQKHGMQPTDWIRALGSAHEMLALGTPQQKVMMGAKLINDYKIDPQALFQVLSGAIQYQQTQAPQIDVNKVIEEKLTEREIQGEFNKFLSQVEEKYPHYEQVKDTMAGLLQAGLAQDYAGAYEAAIRHPRHADIFDALQKQQADNLSAQAAEQAKAAVTRAKSNAVSTKSATPSGPVITDKGNKSLRDELSSNFDAIAGRV